MCTLEDRKRTKGLKNLSRYIFYLSRYLFYLSPYLFFRILRAINFTNSMNSTNLIAQRIFPCATKTQARRNFTKLIKRNPRLKEKLMEAGFTCSDRFISNRALQVLYAEIGAF